MASFLKMKKEGTEEIFFNRIFPGCGIAKP
jgi:hypothetical protein